MVEEGHYAQSLVTNVISAGQKPSQIYTAKRFDSKLCQTMYS